MWGGNSLMTFFGGKIIVNRNVEDRHKQKKKHQPGLASPPSSTVLKKGGGQRQRQGDGALSSYPVLFWLFDSQTDWRKIEVKIIISFVHKLTTLCL